MDIVMLAAICRSCNCEFLDSLRRPMINIHHSFLPAFKARPYRQAHSTA